MCFTCVTCVLHDIYMSLLRKKVDKSDFKLHFLYFSFYVIIALNYMSIPSNLTLDAVFYCCTANLINVHKKIHSWPSSWMVSAFLYWDQNPSGMIDEAIPMK